MSSSPSAWKNIENCKVVIPHQPSVSLRLKETKKGGPFRPAFFVFVLLFCLSQTRSRTWVAHMGRAHGSCTWGWRTPRPRRSTLSLCSNLLLILGYLGSASFCPHAPINPVSDQEEDRPDNEPGNRTHKPNNKVPGARTQVRQRIVPTVTNPVP